MLDDLHRQILSVVAARDQPVGQGAIGLELRSAGVTASVPTIGRRLQELEFEGFVKKVGVQGRVVTELGKQTVDRLNAEAGFRVSGDAFLKTLNRGDKQHLLHLLSARSVVEGATAALAAEHATAQTIVSLENSLLRQEAIVSRGELGIEEDIDFHDQIARASGNPVLATLASLLRQHHRYNLAITSIRAAVGSRLVVDHSEILEAIKERNPVEARMAMKRHIRMLADDLTRYWTDSLRTDR